MGDEPAVATKERPGNFMSWYQPGVGSGGGDRSLSFYVGTKENGGEGFFKNTEWSSGN